MSLVLPLVHCSCLSTARVLVTVEVILYDKDVSSRTGFQGSPRTRWRPVRESNNSRSIVAKTHMRHFEVGLDPRAQVLSSFRCLFRCPSQSPHVRFHRALNLAQGTPFLFTPLSTRASLVDSPDIPFD
ncbi:hypothetical protein BDV98DRAFT_345377 [Pterulicium gracile]|uniref:Secreted protein n=1 Tax=Pterulicium gracile TaxID=1884261 RepID=A0A5C3Q6A1_9AGAR|nr:hypothetical protein BDV98DRAFT_345377 [Pterula gracilis]